MVYKTLDVGKKKQLEMESYPLKCAVASSRVFFAKTKGGQGDDIGVKEGVEDCKPNQDICYLSITMVTLDIRLKPRSGGMESG